MKIPILTAVIFQLITTFSAAQVMVPQTSVIKTPYGNVNNTTWRIVGHPYNFGQNVDPYVLTIKGKFTVVMKSDSVFTDKLNLTLTDSVNSLIINRSKRYGGDIIIHPEDTKQVRQVYNGKIYTGIPSDSCWLFKIIPGAINCYAPFPTENSDFVIAVQKGDGPILPMTKDNLNEMIDDPILRKTIQNGKLYRAVWKYNGSR